MYSGYRSSDGSTLGHVIVLLTLFMIRISHLKVFVDKKVEAQQIKCSTSSVEFLTDAMKAGCHNLMHTFLKW